MSDKEGWNWPQKHSIDLGTPRCLGQKKSYCLVQANSMLSFSHPHFLSALTLMNDSEEPKPGSKGYIYSIFQILFLRPLNR